MRKKKKEKKGISPLFAAVLLLGSMGVVGKAMLGGGAAAVVGLAINAAPDGNPEEVSSQDDSKVVDTGVKWNDLLAVYGSYTRGGEVRHGFTSFEYPSNWTGPTDVGTESEAPAGRWVGEDPPMLRLGVVMVSQASRRAVLGGKVVGVGDTAGGGKITAIEPGLVTLQWDGRKLTYDLDANAPREFRSELALRQSEQLNKEDAAEAGASTDSKTEPANKDGSGAKPDADKTEGDK